MLFLQLSVHLTSISLLQFTSASLLSSVYFKIIIFFLSLLGHLTICTSSYYSENLCFFSAIGILMQILAFGVFWILAMALVKILSSRLPCWILVRNCKATQCEILSYFFSSNDIASLDKNSDWLKVYVPLNCSWNITV